MSNTDVILKEARPLDEFDGWTDEAESDGEQFSERSIIGQRVKFSNAGQWLLPDTTELTKLLIVANVRRTVVKWGKNKGPPETIFLKPGEKFPDLAKRNEETPKSEWITDFNGAPKGPWEAQHVTYLIDPVSVDQYSYPTATVGGGIATRELVDRIQWMRRMRGNVYPIVRLATRPMKAKSAWRPRPHFEICDWTRLDHDSGGAIPASESQQLLPKPTEQLPQQPAEQQPAAATNQVEKLQAALRTIGAQTVEPPTLKEEAGDEIVF